MDLQETSTPARRARRLPKGLWGTPQAAEMRTQLANLRQSRRRARRKAHEARFLRRQGEGVAPDEEEDGDVSGVDPLDSDDAVGDPEDRGDENRDDLYGGPPPMEVEETNGENSTNIPPRWHSRLRPDDPEPDIDRIVRELINIKVTSRVSDKAIEKLFSFFCKERLTIGELLQSGQITSSFIKSIKPKAIRQIPPILSSVTLQEEGPSGPILKKVKNLAAIPKAYQSLRPGGPKRLLTTEAYVSLRHIKTTYLLRHRDKEGAIRDLQETQISADGVKESNKGKRTFVIVSLRIKDCIYPYRIFNPLIGVSESKPSPVDVLR